MNKEEKRVEFTGRTDRCVYDSDSYKVYGFVVDKAQYPDIKRNKYNNVTVVGDLPDLIFGSDYHIHAIEQESKYGISYKVVTISKDAPTTPEGVYKFLTEILTLNQAKTLYEHYPDIIDRVREDRLDDIDLNKLNGIKEYTFNVIKRKITENFALFELVSEFQGYLTLSMIRKIFEKYNSILKFKHELAKSPYECLCTLAGVGFKTADKILLQLEKLSEENKEQGKEPIVQFNYDLATSSQRCLACALYLLSENENDGHTKMNAADLRKEINSIVPQCAYQFENIIKDKDIYYDETNMDIALMKTYNTEKYIADTIKQALAQTPTTWKVDIEQYRHVDGFELSDEQLHALSNVCSNKISILNGFAGCGKSLSVKAIVKMLEDSRYTYRLMTPTGKSSKVLANFTHRDASTIHRGLGYNPSYGENPWTINKTNPLTCDIVIVDEFSMVDIHVFARLIDAIDFSRTRLMLIGDAAQLPSVGCGNLLHDFIQSKTIPITTLTKVFRYSDGGLMKIATDVRNTTPYLNSSMKRSMTSFGENKDYTFVDLDASAIPASAVALYEKLLKAGNTVDNIRVLSAQNIGNCGTVVLNNLIQKVANPNYGSDRNMKIGDTTYYEQDLVVQKANNYTAMIDPEHYTAEERDLIDFGEIEPPTAFIANGESGIITNVGNSYIVIQFDNDVYIRYDKSEISQMLNLGYATSIHKSQGESIDNIIVCTPQSHIYMLNSNLIY